MRMLFGRVLKLALLLAAVLTLHVSEAGTAPTGLVAAYGFNEGSGMTVTDASGNGNTGTISNTTWAATGKFGKALQFNGTSARVDIPDAASLHLTTGDDPGGVGQSHHRRRQLARRDLQGQRQLLPRGDLHHSGRARPAAGSPAAPTVRPTAPRRCPPTPGRIWPRPTTGSPCACTSTGRRSRRTPRPAPSHLDQPAADRRGQHLRPVLRRAHRRGARLQPRAHRRPRSRPT